jgi:hypothetical protein
MKGEVKVYRILHDEVWCKKGKRSTTSETIEAL